MARKEGKKTECPECHVMIGAQGLPLHRLHKHGVRGKNKNPEPKEENIVEEIMTNEETKEDSKPIIEQPKEELKPEPEQKTPVGDEKKPDKKGSSFLDWLFGDSKDEDKDKSSVSKSDKKEPDDDDWW